MLIPVVDEIGLCDVLLLKEKARDEVQGLAFRVLLHVNRNNLVNIHIFYHQKYFLCTNICKVNVFATI
jgi:hypothetical protein